MTQEWIPLCDPDVSRAELEAVSVALQSPRLGQGPVVEEFEAAFAAYVGRKHAVAVASGTLGMLLCLEAYDIGPGHQVVTSSYAWHQVAHAIALAGARPVFADIDYWSGTMVPEKAAELIAADTHAIIAGNVNGHPAAWEPLRALAERHGLLLIEDSTEAIGSTYQGKPVGGFGDCAVFDFAQPGALVCGEGGMVVTDDERIAAKLRARRSRRIEERHSVVAGATPPYRAGMSDVTAALALAQLRRVDAIFERRRQTEHYYYEHVKSFEGIKDPYVAPEVTGVNWFLYLVHLGTRFTRSSRDAIVDDLRTAGIEATAYCQPMHLQRHYLDMGHRRGKLFVTEKVADRVVALPFHAHLDEEQVAFIVQTLKDASVNVGAGSAIYL